MVIYVCLCVSLCPNWQTLCPIVLNYWIVFVSACVLSYFILFFAFELCLIFYNAVVAKEGVVPRDGLVVVGMELEGVVVEGVEVVVKRYLQKI